MPELVFDLREPTGVARPVEEVPCVGKGHGSVDRAHGRCPHGIDLLEVDLARLPVPPKPFEDQGDAVKERHVVRPRGKRPVIIEGLGTKQQPVGLLIVSQGLAGAREVAKGCFHLVLVPLDGRHQLKGMPVVPAGVL